MLTQSRLSTAEEVAQEIEDYWDAIGDDKNQAGFIAPVGKDLMECHTTLERVVAQRAKEKIIKDSDFNPSVVNNESLVDTATGVGEFDTKKPVLV